MTPRKRPEHKQSLRGHPCPAVWDPVASFHHLELLNGQSSKNVVVARQLQKLVLARDMDESNGGLELSLVRENLLFV